MFTFWENSRYYEAIAGEGLQLISATRPVTRWHGGRATFFYSMCPFIYKILRKLYDLPILFICEFDMPKLPTPCVQVPDLYTVR